ncbi:hypothetical protein CERZMDRAFT_90859 [Cercospora zeae-maydis SCOH1-5]|uniref:Uncharacterized protein n=1 Tax=Cercospora zeae-maydis SCOH1-5 TaxID=717836 RepID=A0A6A6FE62_9PEZI|nr:hypothetical protein CERZMDRAFT_90859 [Cercospora zeae-maydis SCOH1-5]
MQLPAPTIPERAGFYSVLPNAHWRRDLPRHTARVHAQSMSFGSHTTICSTEKHCS